MKSRSIWVSIITGAFLIVRVSAEDAAVRYSSSAPAEHVWVRHSADDPQGYQLRNTGTSRRDLGQTFRAPSNATLLSFSYKVLGNIQFDAADSPVTIKIFEAPDRYNLGTLISTQKAVWLSSSLNPVNPGWVTFDVSDVTLMGGMYYTCIISFDLQGATMSQVWAVDAAQGYEDGKTWKSLDGTNYSGTALDMNFSVQAVPASNI